MKSFPNVGIYTPVVSRTTLPNGFSFGESGKIEVYNRNTGN